LAGLLAEFEPSADGFGGEDSSFLIRVYAELPMQDGFIFAKWV